MNALWSIAIAYLYLNSAVRLKRAGIVKPAPEPQPKLARAPKLD